VKKTTIRDARLSPTAKDAAMPMVIATSMVIARDRMAAYASMKMGNPATAMMSAARGSSGKGLCHHPNTVTRITRPTAVRRSTSFV